MSEQSGEREASLAGLEGELAGLDEGAGRLDTAVSDEIGSAGRARAPWSAALEALAENVMPLSLKDDALSPPQRRLEAMRRRRVRLLREAAVLRERTAALRAQMAWLRAQSVDVAHQAEALRSWSAN